jgi:hypothetical protein
LLCIARGREVKETRKPREIFLHLEELDLLEMESPIDRICLFIVFQPCIQDSLNETLALWNLHKIHTAKYKSPQAIYVQRPSTEVTGQATPAMILPTTAVPGLQL